MKKQYIAPETEVNTIAATSVICVSVKFGDGDTNVMYSRERDDFDDHLDELSEDDSLW